MPKKLPSDRKRRNLVILGIQKAIGATFESGDWREVGYRTGTDDWIGTHARLLRSLYWGDPDYLDHTLNAIEHILEEDPANLDVLLEMPKIATWLKENAPDALNVLEGAPVPAVAVPTLAVRSEALERALRESEALINTTGPSSAVDRVHTSLHAYFIAVCDARGISYNPDPSITELFKLIRKHHPSLQDAAHGDQVLQVLQGFASIIHVLNELRNRASGAHPNPVVLGANEAVLVINATRSMFAYLNATLQ